MQESKYLKVPSVALELIKVQDGEMNEFVYLGSVVARGVGGGGYKGRLEMLNNW